jgi:hypothetical protein
MAQAPQTVLFKVFFWANLSQNRQTIITKIKQVAHYVKHK